MKIIIFTVQLSSKNIEIVFETEGAVTFSGLGWNSWCYDLISHYPFYLIYLINFFVLGIKNHLFQVKNKGVIIISITRHRNSTKQYCVFILIFCKIRRLSWQRNFSKKRVFPLQIIKIKNPEVTNREIILYLTSKNSNIMILNKQWKKGSGGWTTIFHKLFFPLTSFYVFNKLVLNYINQNNRFSWNGCRRYPRIKWFFVDYKGKLFYGLLGIAVLFLLFFQF